MEPLGRDDPLQIGAYRLLGRLGAGGMGRVYLGRTAGGRTVAVKVVRSELADDGEFRERFRQEVAAARRVGGAWTAQVLDADTESAQPWVATGYVAGPSLSEAVGEFGPLPRDAVCALVAGLAEALDAVHGSGLVHRDVKPSNVLLAMDGPRLIDFGIARALDATSSLTRSGVVVGSPGHMSPEQVTGGRVGSATDVFSLGTVLVFAALGRGPFAGDSAAVLLYRVAHEQPDLTGLDGPLRRIAEACLLKDPAQRPHPSDVVRMVTPGGRAAPLFQAGWLPAPLVASVSRKTSELLDLDLDTPRPGDAPQPVPGFGPAYPSAPAGHQQPPQPRPTLYYQAAGHPSGPAYTPSAPQDAIPPYHHPTPTGPQDAVPGHPALSGHGAPGGAGGPGQHPQGNRRPQGARIVMLAAAAAAAVAAATAAALVLLPNGGGSPNQDQDRGSKGSSKPRSDGVGERGSPSASKSEQPAGERDDVPKAFVGKWAGPTTSQGGTPSTMTITIRGGRVGTVVARDDSKFPLFNVDCSGDYKLRSATDDRIVLDNSGNKNPAPGVCSNGSDNETFTLRKDGTLRYQSNDQAGGRPSGDLRKAD